jgi:hypothetical protein
MSGPSWTTDMPRIQGIAALEAMNNKLTLLKILSLVPELTLLDKTEQSR